MTNGKKPTFRTGAILTLLTMVTGLFIFVWGASAEFSSLKSNIEKKAEKSTVDKLVNRMDRILLGLCILDKRTCILKEETK